MKKVIFVLFLCLLGIGAMNRARAQTKEETIEWLEEKLEKHFKDYCYLTARVPGIHYSLLSVEVNECEINYKCEYWWPFSGGTTEWYTFRIPIQDLQIRNGKYYLNYEGIEIIQTGSTYAKDLPKSKFSSNLESEFGINPSGEADIEKRIQKAIIHLATFCPQKKETF